MYMYVSVLLQRAADNYKLKNSSENQLLLNRNSSYYNPLRILEYLSKW